MHSIYELAIVALVSLPSLQGSWLDRGPSNWNRTASSLPTPARSSDAGDSRSRCGEMIREPESPGDRALVRAGWLLYGPIQSYGPTKVVTALSGFDGSCRPLGHQAFVYWEERYAGTLAPQPMNSRTDGSLVNYRLMSQTKITAEFARYTPNDPLCCPTRTTLVEYEVRRDDMPLVSPVSISLGQATAGNANETSQDPGRGSPQLAGRKWRLTAINGAAVSAANPYVEGPHIQFDEATRKISGDSGCNRVSGSYELSGSTLRFSGVATTKRACVDFAAQQIESNLQKALSKSASFTVQDDTLRLSADGPIELTFNADSADSARTTGSTSANTPGGGSGQPGVTANTPGGGVGQPRVTGSVTYRQRVALPPDAVIEVKLMDVPRAGVQAVTIAEQTIRAEGRQVPIQFELSYDPSKIQKSRQYVIGVRIMEGGRMLFTTSNIYQVLTQGYPNNVNVTVVPASRQ